MMPRVSVVLPTRNRKDSLARALASVEAQRYREFEVVVVDDASTDGTASWLREKWPAVSLVELARPSGAAAARNRGVERSRGEIVAFLDDDDTWHPSYLEVQLSQFEANPEVDLCSTGHIEIGSFGHSSLPDLRPLHQYTEPLLHFMAECPIHTLSVVACRRTLFSRIGRFDEELSVVHDLDFYLRLAAAGGRMKHYSAALVERAVPGGLVTRHRQWFQEEQAVHRRVFEASHCSRRNQRRIRATRSLFFARVGLARGDFGFGIARLAEACLVSPSDAMRVALRRLRRLKGAPNVADIEAWEAR
jgi:glycosyltransferase involved in cell wall biosynthesis